MKSRSQQFLDAIEAGDPSLLPSPITREERFLHALSTGEEITPTTFEEQFMQAARAFKGSGGGSVGLTNLFDGNYIVGYLSGTNTNLTSDVANGYSGSTGIVVPVIPGHRYLIGKHTESPRFRTLFLERYPLFNNTDEIMIGVEDGIDHTALPMSISLVAPPLSTYLFIFLGANVQPKMTVIDQSV